MGCWNETCMVTQMPILTREKVVLLILKRTDNAFSPISLPIVGIYDDYGTLGENSIELKEFHLTTMKQYDDFEHYTSLYKLIRDIEKENILDKKYALALIQYDIFEKMTTYATNKYNFTYERFVNDLVTAKTLPFTFKDNRLIRIKKTTNNLFLEVCVNRYFDYPMKNEIRHYVLHELLTTEEINEQILRLVLNLNLFHISLNDARKVYQTYRDYNGSQQECFGVHLLISDYMKDKIKIMKEKRIKSIQEYASDLDEEEMKEEINYVERDYKIYQ